MLSSTANNAITTIGHGADFLKVNQQTICRLASAKKIQAFKVGGSWRFSKIDIDLWKKSNPQSMEFQTNKEV